MSPALLLLAATAGASPAVAADLKLPPGFTAKLYADNPVAPDVYTMTIDDAGRVLIAGRGYVRVLVDDDNDGSADRAVDLIDGLKDGPMGLLAEGDSLFVMSDGGLKRYRGYNGRDKLKEPELLLALKTGGEHDAHAIRRGPDGWLYVLCGNMAGVSKATNTDRREPVRDPVAGALVRLSPDFKTVEVVADGFRNPYSFDFNPDGEAFTYDSDNERCLGLPWYEGCRFYHVVPGGNYGWQSPQRSQTWRKPPYFPDVVPPIADLGRGSPTGVACYRHTQFPAKYRGGFFLADWTFGRIHFVPLTASGSSYQGKPEVFAEATGISGFAPTALAVHPKTGELFVSIGGRGTRGGVYRLAFDTGDANPKPLPMAKRSLDYDKASAERWLKDAKQPTVHLFFPVHDPRTQRRALELMARYAEKLPYDDDLFDAVKRALLSPDPLVRAVAARIATTLVIPVGDVSEVRPPTRAQIAVALASAADDPAWALKVACGVLDDPNPTPEEVIAALRLVQLAHGDLTAKAAVGTVWEGYTFRDELPKARTDLIRRLIKFDGSDAAATTDRLVRLELARTLAALAPSSKDAVRVPIEYAKEASEAADKMHHLIAVARLSDRDQRLEELISPRLFEFTRAMKKQNVPTDRHWPLRWDEVLSRLGTVNAAIGAEVLGDERFGGPDDVAFVRPLLVNRAAAAKKFVARAKEDKNFAWSPTLVELLGELPVPHRYPMLLELWERPGLEDAVLRLLASDPRSADRPKFLGGLKSLDADLVRLSADSLAKLPVTEPKDAYVAALRALRRFPDEKPNATVRAALAGLLQKLSGETFGADEKVWAAGRGKRHPDAAKALEASDGFDATAWKKRLDGIAWDKGDAARGRTAFTKATCAACHDGGRAVGPSLVGVAKRFSRDDLLTAILQPNKDVPARYRPTRVTTTDEKSYTGVIVYEAADGVILQTGADTTVRVAGADIASKKLVDVSLMPAGLLDKLSDAEVADLLTYLGALK